MRWTKTERLGSNPICSKDSGTKSLSNERKPTEVSFLSQPAFRTQPGAGAVLARLNSSVGSADLWQEGFTLGGVLQTFGQQHFVLCRGQLVPSAVAFKLAPSRKLKSVVLRLNASNATAATTVLKIPCMIYMLKPEAQRSKTILIRHGPPLVRPEPVSSGSLGTRLSQLRLVPRTLDDGKSGVFREVRITG